MNGFFEFLDYVTSSDFVRSFVKGYAVVANWMLSPITFPGSDVQFSVLSVLLGVGILAYLAYVLVKFLIPI